MARILIVDDEQSLREFLEILLRKAGHDVTTASSGEAAVALWEDEPPPEIDLVITDLKMNRVTGIDVLRKVKEVAPETEVIVMTAYQTTETAIEAMKLGAYDYTTKPFKVDEIKVLIGKALEKRELALENRRLRSQVRERVNFENFVGRSRAIRDVFDIVERVSTTRASVLIVGETGTGKELVAKAIHFNSPRRERPFLVINCGAIPDQLMESELFGHMKGSFTGAYADKKGLFEEASGGTLFLDEIGELTLPLQVKLLRALQERKIKRVGAAREVDIDVRIVAATNRDLEEEVKRERFRSDLYYRLNVVQIRVPALRERKEDVPLLAQHFLRRLGDDLGRVVRAIHPRAMEALCAYHFPGNVRELENIVERALTFEMSDVLMPDSLPSHLIAPPGLPDLATASTALELPQNGVDLERILADLEKVYLAKALDRTRGNRTEAAKVLGISFRSIRYKLAKYGMGDEDGES